MKKLVYIILALILTLSLFGCSNNKENEKIGIRGEITKLNQGKDIKVFFIFVEGPLEMDTEFDKASITITEKTRIIEKATNKKLSKNDLKEGMKVEVLVDGPVRESYPVQFDAKEVRVIN